MPEKQTKVENFEAYILKFLKQYKTVQIHLQAVTYVSSLRPYFHKQSMRFIRQVLKFNILLAFDHFYGVDYRLYKIIFVSMPL